MVCVCLIRVVFVKNPWISPGRLGGSSCLIRGVSCDHKLELPKQGCSQPCSFGEKGFALQCFGSTEKDLITS